MDILLWLLPTVVVTAVAMVWAGWAGREGRGAVDRDVAVQRFGEALGRRSDVPGYAVARPPSDRSTGIAVRPSSRRRAPLGVLSRRPRGALLPCDLGADETIAP